MTQDKTDVQAEIDRLKNCIAEVEAEVDEALQALDDARTALEGVTAKRDWFQRQLTKTLESRIESVTRNQDGMAFGR